MSLSRNAATSDTQQTAHFERSKKFIEITKEDIEHLFKYPQPKAAQILGVSVSTLKRRFYEVTGGLTRWPYATIKKNLKKGTMKHILNPKDKPTTLLDPYTICTLKNAFKNCHSRNARPIEQ